MTNAWFLGAAGSVPQTSNEVRSTVEPVRTDNVSAEQVDAPEWNEFDSDESGELVGLSPRVAGSDTHDIEQTAPFWAALATAEHNQIVDRQVATSGTAAAREMAGEHGHGTMQYALGIEPVIRAGASFGNDYFVSHSADIQDGAGAYMAPTENDNWAVALAAANAEKNSRKAFQSTQYDAFLGV